MSQIVVQMNTLGVQVVKLLLTQSGINKLCCAHLCQAASSCRFSGAIVTPLTGLQGSSRAGGIQEGLARPGSGLEVGSERWCDVCLS